MPFGMIGEQLVCLLPFDPKPAQSIGLHAATLGRGNGGVKLSYKDSHQKAIGNLAARW